MLVVADEAAEARFIAVDFVTQAKHDPNASVIAVTGDADLTVEVVAGIERRTGEHEYAETIETALEGDASGIPLVRSMSGAVLFAEEYAAGHLTIQADGDEVLLDRIDSVGSVFPGPYTSVAAGGYISGTNHVLPIGGGAK